jgi:hypothetical protein
VAFTGPRRGSLSVDAGLDRRRPRDRSSELVRALRRALRARKALLVLREHAYMMYLSKVLTHGASTKHAMLSDHVSGHMTTRRIHMLLHGQTDR